MEININPPTPERYGVTMKELRTGECEVLSYIDISHPIDNIRETSFGGIRMNEQLKQGLENYKKEFTTYTNWLQPKINALAKETGARVTGTILFKRMPLADWREHCEWLRKLENIEKELELGENEIEQIAKEVGYLDINWG